MPAGLDQQAARVYLGLNQRLRSESSLGPLPMTSCHPNPDIQSPFLQQ
ncbi:MAG: hypothetical protein KTR25_04755 [Myxococcales bacterium]|nr:hypothetical protein [Myxococcales bacterium]